MVEHRIHSRTSLYLLIIWIPYSRRANINNSKIKYRLTNTRSIRLIESWWMSGGISKMKTTLPSITETLLMSSVITIVNRQFHSTWLTCHPSLFEMIRNTLKKKVFIEQCCDVWRSLNIMVSLTYLLYFSRSLDWWVMQFT